VRSTHHGAHGAPYANQQKDKSCPSTAELTPKAVLISLPLTLTSTKLLTDEDVRNALRAGIENTRKTLPFQLIAWVLLPDHMHCIWTLPEGDADFATRWGMIKRHVSQCCAHRLHQEEVLNDSMRKRNELSLWQRRYWEHQIRDENDLARHVDYIHWNPLKHGLVDKVSDWPYSTFHRYVGEGVYPKTGV